MKRMSGSGGLDSTSKANTHKQKLAVSGRSQRLYPAAGSVTVGCSSSPHLPLEETILLLENVF